MENWALPAAIGFQLVWAMTEGSYSLRYRETIEPTVTEGFPLWQGIAGLITVMVVFVESAISPPPHSWVLPLSFGVFGLFLRCWSIRTLKGRFRDSIDLQMNHTIEESGPYRWVRHPAEMGFLMAFFGFCVLGGFVSVSLFVLLIAPLSLTRIALENRMLSQAQRLSPS